jgi:hypothetical protein
MRVTRQGRANLRTRNESALRGAIEVMAKRSRGQVDSCYLYSIDDITAFVEFPEDIFPASFFEAASAEGFAVAALIPLSLGAREKRAPGSKSNMINLSGNGDKH